MIKKIINRLFFNRITNEQEEELRQEFVDYNNKIINKIENKIGRELTPKEFDEVTQKTANRVLGVK